MPDNKTDSFIQIKDGDWDNLNRSLRYIYNQLNAITGNIGVSGAPDGKYTPVFTNAVNINNGPVGNETRFVRILDKVIVFGEAAAGTILAVTPTSFEMSLPIPPRFKKEYECAGVAFSASTSGQGVSIVGNVANQTALFQWNSVDAAIQLFSFVLVYAVN